MERQGWISRLVNGAIGALVGIYAYLDDLLRVAFLGIAFIGVRLLQHEDRSAAT